MITIGPRWGTPWSQCYDYRESELRLRLTGSQTYADEVASLSPIRLDGDSEKAREPTP